MRKFHFFFFAAIGLYACSGRNYTVQKKLDDPFFHRHTWSYAWFMLQDDSTGKLSTTMADENGHEVMDTTQYAHTAFCTMKDWDRHVVHYASAWKNRDTLHVNIEEFTVSTNDNISIEITGKKMKWNYFTTYIFPVEPGSVLFTPLKEKLVLNTAAAQVRDTLKGYIDFTWLRSWKNEPGPPDTLSIKGPFKCVVKTKYDRQ